MIPGTMIPSISTQAKVIGGIIIVVIAGIIMASCQSSCGRKHETNAAVQGAVADTHAAELKDLKQQLAGRESEIETLKQQGLAFKAKYEAAKAKIPLRPLPAPVTEAGLTQAVVALGMGHATQVQVGVDSVLNTVDATLVWTLSQEATRAKALDEALITCAQAEKAQEDIVAAQTTQLNLSAKALAQSEAEAAARASQAQELGKALKVEKQKRWQKYAWGAAGLAAGLLIKK